MMEKMKKDSLKNENIIKARTSLLQDHDRSSVDYTIYVYRVERGYFNVSCMHKLKA